VKQHLSAALVVCVVAAGASPFVSAQEPAAATSSTFEVASIKPNKSGTRQVSLNLQPGGRFSATNVSLQVLISAAYGDPLPLPPSRLVMTAQWIGGGDYLTSDHFDIEARAGGELTQEQFPFALRQLLADRFKLVVHHETRELPVYHLLVARTDGRLGSQLRRSDVDCGDPTVLAARNPDGTSKCGFRRQSGRVTGRATPKMLERFLNSVVEDRRPVEDHTGLTGTFDLDLEWTPVLPAPTDAPPSPSADPNGPSLFTAVREQLGLKLDPQKSRLDVVVVDHAEQPTEN
jgi:uncharacterized protein (TIGR03435 family)